MVPGLGKQLSQMRRGAIEFCVLSLLRDEDRYGFDISRTLSGFDGLVTSEGTIYPLLARLRQEGYVETTWHESSQGPPRRYYRLTDAGRAALDAFAMQWERFRDSVDKLLEGEGVAMSEERAEQIVSDYFGHCKRPCCRCHGIAETSCSMSSERTSRQPALVLPPIQKRWCGRSSSAWANPRTSPPRRSAPPTLAARDGPSSSPDGASLRALRQLRSSLLWRSL